MGRGQHVLRNEVHLPSIECKMQHVMFEGEMAEWLESLDSMHKDADLNPDSTQNE